MVVQKFFKILDLSIGSYVSGILSIVLAFISIFHLPPAYPDGDEDNDGVTDSPVTETPEEEDKNDGNFTKIRDPSG
jgi:hypothetical protein